MIMGSCLSSEGESSPQTAKIILPNGTLQEFSAGVTAEEVLQSNPACFVCDSDSMSYDEPIPSLSPLEPLQLDRLYFVLPTTKLKQPLAASDMAALAVKASLAMSAHNKKKKKLGRVTPVSVRVGSGEFKTERKDQRTTGSVRRFQRNASLKAKFASRSFKLRLSTIHEEIIC